MTADDRLPLSGRRVVALEHAVSAPLCSRHLADLGADVIKIERPDGGDFARRYDSVARGQSAYFVWLNAGKRSMTADLTISRDRATFEQLLGTADVLVHNLGPGAVDRLGYGWDHLHRRHPRLISCAISGYGANGPYRDRKAFDLLLQGESGLASITGTGDAPARVGISIVDISAGMYALAAVLAALIEREATDVGRSIDISMLDSIAEWMSVPALHQRYAGAPPPRTGLHHPGIAPYGPYAAAGGTVRLIAVQNEPQWRRFCARVLGRPDLANDPRFARNELRVLNRVELDAEIASVLCRIELEELMAGLDQADVPHAPVNDVAGMLDHPQLSARGRWMPVATPTGEVTAVAPPLGWPARSASVPALGADTDAILRELSPDSAKDAP